MEKVFFFKLKDGQKEKLEERTKSYFNSQELSDFDKIGQIIQPYIKRINKGIGE